MPYDSPFAVDIPTTDLLTYLFPPEKDDSEKLLWLSAVDPSINLSHRQALQWVRRFGFGLKRLHLKSGDVVMTISPNHVYVPIAYLGSIGYGAVFSGLSPISTVNEAVYQMKHTGAKILLVHPSALATALPAAKLAGLHKDHIFLFSDIDCGEVDGIRDWRSMLGTIEQSRSWQWQRLTFEESKRKTAVINYSSGTTGHPKGVCISHHNIIANVTQCSFMEAHLCSQSAKSPQENERWLAILPLYHAFGQLWNIVMACSLSIPNYVISKFHYELFLSSIQTLRITHIVTAPPILVMLSKRPETSHYDISSLKSIVCGGAPLSKGLQNEVARRFGINVKQTWGGTELTCSATSTPGGMIEETGSAGMLLPNMQCKLLDDSGREVKVGERGEAYFRGPNICMGYWNNESATREAIDEKEGWYRTGDVAVRNKDGAFYVVDRKKEMIKVDGFQVAPADLEALLLENGDIADAAVVGIKRDYNELPRAYVALKSHAKGKVDGASIEKWLADRVAKYKRLRGGVVFVDAIPKSATGKIQRKVIREWVEKETKTGKTSKL